MYFTYVIKTKSGKVLSKCTTNSHIWPSKVIEANPQQYKHLHIKVTRK